MSYRYYLLDGTFYCESQVLSKEILLIYGDQGLKESRVSPIFWVGDQLCLLLSPLKIQGPKLKT